MLFLPHHLFLGSDEDRRDSGGFLKVQANYAPESLKRASSVAAQQVPSIQPGTEATTAASAFAGAATVPIRLGVIGVGTMGQEHAWLSPAPGLKAGWGDGAQAKTGLEVASDFACKC